MAPLKKKSKSRKPLKVNDFQGFLFSSKSQKAAKFHICGGGIGDFFEREKKSHQKASNVLICKILRNILMSSFP
ncbi:MAG: hypothetical protein LUF85_06060 [Bacteroides sp.]|nr:hypothetical protein [Bacteroides sp.]